jgi:pyridoxal phosphate-dependent aminotransferase EpsN
VSRIYLSVPHMSGHEQAYVAEAFRSNWLSCVGPNLDAFESDFSRYIGLPCVALSSGTAAIHLGLQLLGVGSGDEVLCSSFTFVASVNPVVYLGARPVLIDSETTSWNMDPNLLEDALKAPRARRPKAIVLVHIFGQSADLDPIYELSARYGVPVLEDAAEALGATYKGAPVASRSTVGIFSFNGNKMLTTTGGGMLVAKDASWVEKARFWSTQARDPGIGYSHSELGNNYRMSNVLAGIGRGQLRVLAERVAARRTVAFRYQQAFADLEGIELMPQAPWGLHTNWLSCFTLEERKLGCSRDTVMNALAAHDIESRPAWKPMHLQPLYAKAECFGGAVSEDIGRRGLCLPSSSSLSSAEQSRVIEVVRSAVAAARAARSGRPQESAHG